MEKPEMETGNGIWNGNGNGKAHHSLSLIHLTEPGAIVQAVRGPAHSCPGLSHPFHKLPGSCSYSLVPKPVACGLIIKYKLILVRCQLP